MQVQKYKRAIGEVARVYPFDDDTKTFIKIWQEYHFDQEAKKRILGSINLKMQCSNVRLEEMPLFQESIQKAVELAEEISKNISPETPISQSILPAFGGNYDNKSTRP